jgi:hypothetical protein
MMLRLTRAGGVDQLPTASLLGVPILDGNYDLTVIDLESGEMKKADATINQGALKNYKLSSPDSMLIFKRK